MKKLLLTFFVMSFAVVLLACNGETTAPDVTTTQAPTESYDNEEYTLLLQSSTMDGVFNPYFYSSAYDGEVVGLTNVGLLTVDPQGAVVAGDEYPTVAQSYSIYYTDNLTTYAPKTAYEEGDYVVYEMVLKNGAKFSDGTVIDADDVLYNYYVYLDPSYNGSSTLYTLPILGLQEYRTQVPTDQVAVIGALADAILADDTRVSGYATTEAYTETEHDDYWDAMDEAGAAFAGEIVSYVKANYLSDAYVATYLHEGLTAADVAASETLTIAYGMAMWGYGDMLSADKLTIAGASGTVYTVADLTNAKYWEEILAANTVDGKIDFTGGYQGLSDYESAGGDFVALAKELFIASQGVEGDVPTITGLVKGTKTVDGVEHDTVKVVLTRQNPKAILSLGVTVAPQHYYTAGYTPATGSLVNYGVQFNNPLFMQHLASFNGAPMGAGPYKFISVDAADGTVYFERNTNFDTMGGENVFNATIKKVALKIVSSGAEYSALEAGDVHYATVSATADVMSDIAEQEDLVSVLVDNLGYGYILVNPEVYPNLYFRQALQTVFDITKVLDYYPSGLADIIYRSQSQVSWAYPENAASFYPFDETLETTIELFEKAGLVFKDGELDSGWDKTIEFTLPSGADAHPAGGVFLKAQSILSGMGFKVSIISDPNLIANIKKGPVGVYALAWQSSMDPDLYQVYHYESQAESVDSNGITYIYDEALDDTFGTVKIKKMDGTEVEMNQVEAIEYLAELIELGVEYMLPEERKPVYEKALEVLALLAIEIPTYQRKNLFVYDGTIIDQTSLSSTVTPYWGPMNEIWKVSFVGN